MHRKRAIRYRANRFAVLHGSPSESQANVTLFWEVLRECWKSFIHTAAKACTGDRSTN